MSAQRGDGRAQIKRIILVAFIAIIASVEFGLYPFSSSVDFRIRAPTSVPTVAPTAHAGRARAPVCVEAPASSFARKIAGQFSVKPFRQALRFSPIFAT